MTKTERRKLYNGLRKTTNDFRWKLTRDGKIRAILDGNYYCPLTAIAKVETGKRFPSSKAQEVNSPTLDLLPRYGKYSIMSAADDGNLDVLGDEEKVMRKTMMKIVGLANTNSQ